MIQKAMKKEDILSLDIVGGEDNVDIFKLETEVNPMVCRDDEDPETLGGLQGPALGETQG